MIQAEIVGVPTTELSPEIRAWSSPLSTAEYPGLRLTFEGEHTVAAWQVPDLLGFEGEAYTVEHRDGNPDSVHAYLTLDGAIVVEYPGDTETHVTLLPPNALRLEQIEKSIARFFEREELDVLSDITGWLEVKGELLQAAETAMAR